MDRCISALIRSSFANPFDSFLSRPCLFFFSLAPLPCLRNALYILKRSIPSDFSSPRFSLSLKRRRNFPRTIREKERAWSETDDLIREIVAADYEMILLHFDPLILRISILPFKSAFHFKDFTPIVLEITKKHNTRALLFHYSGVIRRDWMAR